MPEKFSRQDLMILTCWPMLQRREPCQWQKLNWQNIAFISNTWLVSTLLAWLLVPWVGSVAPRAISTGRAGGVTLSYISIWEKKTSIKNPFHNIRNLTVKIKFIIISINWGATASQLNFFRNKSPIQPVVQLCKINLCGHVIIYPLFVSHRVKHPLDDDYVAYCLFFWYKSALSWWY